MATRPNNSTITDKPDFIYYAASKQKNSLHSSRWGL